MRKRMMWTTQKLFEGYSACFRQWKAEGTHCRFLHGYAISFSLTFKGDLDNRNWVFDFGGMRRAKTKIDGMSPIEFFKHMFDHTVIIAEDDPHLADFKLLDNDGVIQLRVMPQVGCERFAEFIYDKVSEFLKEETDGRVSLLSVTVRENGVNSATYATEN